MIVGRIAKLNPTREADEGSGGREEVGRQWGRVAGLGLWAAPFEDFLVLLGDSHQLLLPPGVRPDFNRGFLRAPRERGDQEYHDGWIFGEPSV